MVEVQARLHKYQANESHQQQSRMHQPITRKYGGRAEAALKGLEAAAKTLDLSQKHTPSPSGPSSLRAPLHVDGVTVFGRAGNTRPLPLVQGRDVHDPFSAIARDLLGAVAE